MEALKIVNEVMKVKISDRFHLRLKWKEKGKKEKFLFLYF